MVDGQAGPNCDWPTEMVCNNQCSGHGDCWLGFCQCHPGFWGHDCAQRDPFVPLSAPAGTSLSGMGSKNQMSLSVYRAAKPVLAGLLPALLWRLRA